jgi:UDP:flavonoid glycosyltransferase YjiC (YdhE family)
VTRCGIEFFPLPGEFLDLLDSPEAKSAIAGGNGFGPGLKLLGHVRPMMRKLLDAEAEHARSARPDVLVYHPKSIAGPHLAELLACPGFIASPLPGLTPTSAFPSPILPFTSLGPLNKLSHLAAIHGASFLFAGELRRWRNETLAIQSGNRRGRKPAGTLYAYSPHVLPKPSDWGDDICVSGYWFLDTADYTPPSELERFLANGDPPVYVGFGSMPGIDAEAAASAFVAALSARGRRGVIATGGGALAKVEAPPSITFIDAAPHDCLFPRMRAIIHHGGAGTTGAALRAGKPSVCCPFFGDQPFWGRTVKQLGAGPSPLDRRSLSQETIGRALAGLEAETVVARAAAIGASIREERGTVVAASFLEQQVTAWPRA